MARTDLGTARAVKRHAVFARVDVADIDRRIEPGAARDGGVQIAKGHPARVGGIIAATDQRMASLDPVALQHRGGFVTLDLEPPAPLGVVFATQTLRGSEIAVPIVGTTLRVSSRVGVRTRG